ncbi:MAG: iron ABC transporter permease [Desulfobulbaceae bacterium]
MSSTNSLSLRITLVFLCFGALLTASILAGLSIGSADVHFRDLIDLLNGRARDTIAHTIILEIRLPRVVLAAVVGASLALGGLVFQALLRNPLAEPYILGVSGGSAIGAILALLAGFSFFPGAAVASFAGSMLVLGLLLFMAAGRSFARSDSLLLGGVMINALCGAVIMFLISLARDAQVQHVLFWLMGDLSMFGRERFVGLLIVLPCFAVIFLLARPMNLLLMGRENAAALGVNVRLVTNLLLFSTTLMVSVAVSHAGLIGFVGLVVPHILRMTVGPDHRLLAPACILGGGAYLVLCDLLARSLPASGEMPVGVITALVGAPLFILLLWRGRR